MWTDYRNHGINDLDADVYAQRIDSMGRALWALNGIPICDAHAWQGVPSAVSDGNGGAMIVWMDARRDSGAMDIYAQHIDASGHGLWNANGIAICTFGDEASPVVALDGTGGALFVWEDWPQLNANNLYAQRVNALGVAQWTNDGIPICMATNISHEEGPQDIVCDGQGGAIIAWQDSRSGTQVYAQHVDGGGVAQWTVNGIKITSVVSEQGSPQMIADGTGGAYVSWDDKRKDMKSKVYPGIYAQRISASGAYEWADSGAAMSRDTSGNGLGVSHIVSDDTGGAIIGWNEYHYSTNKYDARAQRVDPSGRVLWSPNGVLVCESTPAALEPRITSDSYGGAILTWEDMRNATKDIYAQRVNSAGVALWNLSGVPVSTAPTDQTWPTICGDGKGGAIISFYDTRNDFYSTDLFVQNIDKFGALGFPAPVLTSIQDVPNDQGGKVCVNWIASPLDRWHGGVAAYTLWQKTAGWVWLASIPADASPTYSYIASTPADSTALGIPYVSFYISAHASDSTAYWNSNIDSGYSVDNLAPGAVDWFNAQLLPDSLVRLSWAKDRVDPDVGSYVVYRAFQPRLPLKETARLVATRDTVFIDTTYPYGTPAYYRVTVCDIHGNESLPSLEDSAGVLAITSHNYPMRDRWNLVSVPLNVDNYRKEMLYPNATSLAFTYQGAYVAQETLANDVGYWLKFDGSQNVSMTGWLRIADTVDVKQGWNLVGSLSLDLRVSQITSLPSNIVTSQFFGYRGEYFVADTLRPAKGYWVKVNQSGKLILSAIGGDILPSRIRIAPNTELPPPPPEGQASNPLHRIPLQFTLGQNFPNPFNPATRMDYQLAKPGYVSIVVYNLLGQETATLVQTQQDAGYYSTAWNAGSSPSGIYYVRMTVSDQSGKQLYATTKKLVLMK